MDIEHMEERYREFKRRHFLWPMFLIILGLIFLFENFGLIPEFFLVKLWPLLLIIWGADMLLRRYHNGLHKH